MKLLLVLLGMAPLLSAQVAGRAHRLAPLERLARGTDVSVETTPASEEEFSFAWGADSGAGLLVIPSLAAPGPYEVTLRWQDSRGVEQRQSFTMHVQAPPPVEASAAAAPVVLLNGFQFSNTLAEFIRYGTCPVSESTPRSRSTFGELEPLLRAEGFPVLFFDNCVECRGGSIEDCGQALGRFLAKYPTTSGEPLEQADLIGHSMGGLIARSYLAGKQSDGGFLPPDPHRVRKLVLMATPNFGSYLSFNLPFVSRQLPEMTPGSDFLYDLGTWNDGKDDLRGVDALALTGNACGFEGEANASDGLVSTMSASIGFARPPERTRILPYRHTDSVGVLCRAPNVMAKVDGPEHLTARAVLSFLKDGDEWQTIGTTPAEDNVLLRLGAAILEPRPGTTRLISGAGVEWRKSPSGRFFHAEKHPAELTDIWSEGPDGWTRDEARIEGGYTQTLSLIRPGSPDPQSARPAAPAPHRGRE